MSDNYINYISYWEEHIYPLDEQRNNEEEIIKCVDKIYDSYKECKIDLEIININIKQTLQINFCII